MTSRPPLVGTPSGEIPRTIAWTVLAVGGAVALVAAVTDPAAAGGAASQAWPPFVLVAGLLLVGTVAAEEGSSRSPAGCWTGSPPAARLSTPPP